MGQRYAQRPASRSHPMKAEIEFVKGRMTPHFLAVAGRKGRSSAAAFDSCEIENV